MHKHFTLLAAALSLTTTGGHPYYAIAAAAAAADSDVNVAAAGLKQQTCKSGSEHIPYNRPAVANRTFTSPFVEDVITKMKAAIADPNLAQLFENAFPNALDTAIKGWGHNDSFMRSGDIPGMWMRDTLQSLLPYFALQKFAPAGDDLVTMTRGLVMRCLRSVTLDPFANSFNFGAEDGLHTNPVDEDNAAAHQGDLRRPPMTPNVFEGKYELDTAMHQLMLTHAYVISTSDTSVLLDKTASLQHTPVEATNASFFWRAANSTLWMLEMMSLGTKGQSRANGGRNVYQFMRDIYAHESDAYFEYDAWPHEVWTPEGVGMIRSAFRPSDDVTTHDFFVPPNVMALDQLGNLIELMDIATKAGAKEDFSMLKAKATKIISDLEANIIPQALKKKAESEKEEEDADTERILVYETNGRCDPSKPAQAGNKGAKIPCGQFQMDDSNYPSLLALSLMGPKARKIVDQAPGTRSWVLSDRNPFYYCGTVGCAGGSPHTPKGNLWPLAMLYRALTTDNKTEIQVQLDMIKASAVPDGLLHESFNSNNVSDWTRAWFPWPNSLYALTVLLVGEKFPEMIYGNNTVPFADVTNPF